MVMIFLPSLPPPPGEQSKPQANESLTAKSAAVESSLQPTPARQDTVKFTSPSTPHKTEALTDKMYTPPVSTAAAEAPPLQSLPGEFRHSFAELNLDVHVFSKDPAARFVLINAKRYQEGDQLSEGPFLQAITPKGVILHHRGRRFLLAVTH
jgi:general secretion pathway protein B